MDAAILHASTRLPSFGPRVSVDTNFHLKRKKDKDEPEVIHPRKIRERASHDFLIGIGQTHLFFFPDDVNHKVDSQGGFKHPSNLKIISLPN